MGLLLLFVCFCLLFFVVAVVLFSADSHSKCGNAHSCFKYDLSCDLEHRSSASNLVL